MTEVTDSATERLQRKVLYFATSLVAQDVGFEEIDDGIWLIYFSSVLPTTTDERDYIIRG